ncbi:hypothetical protein NRB_07340 [Novosphingobium sp. 11B]
MRGAAILCVAFLLVSAGQTLYHVPYSAMLPEMTEIDAERISLVAWKEAVSRVGILLAASAVPVIVASHADEAMGYRSAGLLFGLVITGSGTLAFLATAGNYCASPTAVPDRLPLREQFTEIARNRPFRLLVLSYVFIMLADEVFSEALVYYAVHVLRRTPAFVGQAYPISSIAAILTVPFWNRLAARNGKRRTFFVACTGMALAWIAILVIPARHGALMLPLMGVIGAFNAGLLMLPNAMVPETIDFDTKRTGMRQEGATYGAWIFCQQTAMAGGGILLSMMLAAIGYVGGLANQPASVQRALTLIIAVLPALFLVIAMVLIARYPLGRLKTEG